MGLERAKSVAELPEDDLLQLRRVGLDGWSDVAHHADRVACVLFGITDEEVRKVFKPLHACRRETLKTIHEREQELCVEHLMIRRTGRPFFARRHLVGRENCIVRPRITGWEGHF